MIRVMVRVRVRVTVRIRVTSGSGVRLCLWYHLGVKIWFGLVLVLGLGFMV